MARRRKPGTPGKTTIPPGLVASVTARLHAEFEKLGFDQDYDLFIVPQQSYLYVEAVRHPLKCGPDCVPVSPPSIRTPLGRIRCTSRDDWEHHPYRWSVEEWDDRDRVRGTQEKLIKRVVIEYLNR